MRTFIAIALPKDIKDSLGDIQKRLRACGADVKWVSPDNIHLTLKFLGEIDEKKLDAVKRSIEKVSVEVSSFSVRLSSFGGFPRISSPRVIWVGIDTGDKEVKELAAGIEDELALAGIPREERAFSTHITLGRTRSDLNLQKLVQELKLLSETPISGPEFPVTKLTLFKSTLTPRGPIYEALQEANLKTT